MKIPLAIVFILTLCFHMVASPFFDGGVRYQFTGDMKRVSLSHTKISNDNHQGSTGTIKVSLWAMDHPYEGGQMDGFRVASYTLEGLKAGYWWNDMTKTLNATLPQWSDYYYMAMTVEEYFTEGYRITDWVNFADAVYLEKPAPPTPPKLNISMEGPYRWQTHPSEGKIEIDTGKITHNRNGHTGSLRIAVWATQNRYNGGQINGYVLGYVQKESLQKGMMYPHIDAYVRYKAPPSGRYYVTMTLSEFDGNAYVIRDYFTYDDTFNF
ncbi:MAG: hypothetical protein MI748_19505 [Opitutales bacterium]|nr:hypothetical protein [Opitutales bacterium]